MTNTVAPAQGTETQQQALAQLLRTPETLVWLLLMALTVTSWVVGANVGGASGNRVWGTITLMTLAFFKVWLVVRYFMETRHAPWELKWSAEAYVWTSYLVVTGYASGLVRYITS